MTNTMSFPAVPTLRCLSFEFEDRWISLVARIDLQADPVFGYVLQNERQDTYDPAGRHAPLCNEFSLEGALWRPSPADALVVASPREFSLLPRAVVRDLPVIVLATVARRLWAGSHTDLGALCHERELPMEPARAMPAGLVRAWRIGRLTQAALQAVWTLEDLVALSASDTMRGRRRARRRQDAGFY